MTKKYEDKRMNRTAVTDAFAEYVSAYDPSDPKIKLKIDHTTRVANLCERIAIEAEVDKDLAWLCGMLHDIGRFEQVRRYNTFSDAISVDHAMLGADLLFEEGLIKRFHVDLSERNRYILEKAIRNHSMYRLESGLDKETISYCNVLRDADKIDIFKVNCDTPLEDIYNVTTEELKRSPVSEEVKKCFLDKTAVIRSLKKYPADYVVAHICLVFELVYSTSRRITKEQGYVDKLLQYETENADTREWFDYMKEHIWEY